MLDPWPDAGRQGTSMHGGALPAWACLHMLTRRTSTSSTHTGVPARACLHQLLLAALTVVAVVGLVAVLCAEDAWLGCRTVAVLCQVATLATAPARHASHVEVLGAAAVAAAAVHTARVSHTSTCDACWCSAQGCLQAPHRHETSAQHLWSCNISPVSQVSPAQSSPLVLRLVCSHSRSTRCMLH